MEPNISTADLYDSFPSDLTLLNVTLQSYGKKESFFGQAVTLKVFEDNSFVKKELQANVAGKVLVVDGGGSRRCALVGDNLAKLAIDNGWSGLVIYGCIRDSRQINEMNVAIKALGTCPVKSIKRNIGLQGETLIIEGTKIKTGDYIYADADGVLVSDKNLD